jgi:hypothetical protein
VVMLTYSQKRYRESYPKEKESLIKANAALRKKRMLQIIKMQGGKCIRCGYDKCTAALDFHHRDPATKSFNINAGTICKAWNTILAEVQKCDLICSNCHREHHAADWTFVGKGVLAERPKAVDC